MKISEISDFEWDEKLKLSPYGEFFHTSFWKNQVCNFIGGKGALYLFENDGKSWLIPFYTGSPWSKGFRLGSIGYGGPIPLQLIQDPINEMEEISKIISSLSEQWQLPCTGWTTFPLKEWSFLNESALNKNQFLSYTQIIPLKNDSHTVFNHVVTGNIRTAIRRAEQSSLKVIQMTSSEDLKTAHGLLCETQERVNASYTTPHHFFSALSGHDQISVWKVSHGNELIAMSMLLIHETKAFHLFHGWKRGDIPPGTNQLLIWEMIKHSISYGCKSFNMGESHSDSLRIAKRRWGCEDYPILKMNYL